MDKVHSSAVLLGAWMLVAPAVGCFEGTELPPQPVASDEDGDADVDTDADTDTDADADADADTDVCDTGPPPESTWCLTVDAAGQEMVLLEVELPSGDVQEIGRYSVGTTSSMHTGGLAYDGSSLVMSVYNGNNFQWLRVDLATGAGTWGPSTGSISVTWDGTWYLVAGSDLAAYPDWSALIAGRAAWTASASGYSRVGAGDGGLFGAWHSTESVRVLDPVTGDYLSTLELEDYDTWVWGIGYAGGYLHLIDDGRQESYQRIVRFDPDTGEQIDFISFAGTGWDPHGLWCSDKSSVSGG